LSQISGKVDPNKANPLDKKPAAGGGPATKPKDMPTERKTAEKKPVAKDEMDDESKPKGKAKGDGGIRWISKRTSRGPQYRLHSVIHAAARGTLLVLLTLSG